MSEIWYGLAVSLAYPSGGEGGNFHRSKWFLPAFPTQGGGGGGVKGWHPVYVFLSPSVENSSLSEDLMPEI